MVDLATRNRVDSLDFVRSMLVQLRGIVEPHDCEMVAFLIEMAYLETEDVLASERGSTVRENN